MKIRKISTLLVTMLVSFEVFADSVNYKCHELIETSEDYIHFKEAVKVELNSGFLMKTAKVNANYEYESDGASSVRSIEKKYSSYQSKILDIGSLQDTEDQLVLTSQEVEGDSIGNGKGSGIKTEKFSLDKKHLVLVYSEKYVSNEDLDKGIDGQFKEKFVLSCDK